MTSPDSKKTRVTHKGGYRVPDSIRPLSLCIFRREDGAILVSQGYDSGKEQHFYRPLGGGIEFGEKAEDAARREIREELGAEIHGLRLLGTFENIFVYLGQNGHELIWLFEAEFDEPAACESDVVMADEGGFAFEAHWVSLDALRSTETPLYPEGLFELLSAEPRRV